MTVKIPNQVVIARFEALRSTKMAGAYAVRSAIPPPSINT
jgi:hypothetical protein